MDRIPLGSDPDPERYEGDVSVEGVDEAIDDLEEKRTVDHQIPEDAPTPTSEWKRQARQRDAGPDVAPDGSVIGDTTNRRSWNRSSGQGVMYRLKCGFRRTIRYLGIFSLVVILLISTVVVGVFLLEGPEGFGDRVGDATGDQELGDQIAGWLESDEEANDTADDGNSVVDGLQPYEPDEDAIAEEVLEGVNEIRDSHGLGELRSNDELAAVSVEHSQDMVAREYFDHVSPGGLGPEDRIREAGFHCDWTGENLGMTPTDERVLTNGDTTRTDSDTAVADVTVDGWVASEGHFEVMTTPEFSSAGVGVAIDQDGDAYVTMKFCG